MHAPVSENVPFGEPLESRASPTRAASDAPQYNISMLAIWILHRIKSGVQEDRNGALKARFSRDFYVSRFYASYRRQRAEGELPLVRSFAYRR
jgi:hypothetical protein